MEFVKPKQKFTNFPRTPLKKEFQGESLENIQEKQILIDNLKINYKQIGDGNIPIILLHGWGVSSDKYLETATSLFLQTTNYKLQTCIFALDLPGFGKSDNPPKAWEVDDYAKLVEEFIQGQSLVSKDCPWIMIGHSFGARIAIKFAAKYPEKLKALVLTGAAGIKRSPTFKQKIFYIAAKIGKVIFSLPLISYFKKPARGLFYKIIHEKDYYQTEGVMKQIFKKVIAEDLTPYLEKIKIPTLLVWGLKDKSTPLADARLMNQKINGSELRIIAEANHSLPYQYPEEFAKIVLEFIKNKAM